MTFFFMFEYLVKHVLMSKKQVPKESQVVFQVYVCDVAQTGG